MKSEQKRKYITVFPPPQMGETLKEEPRAEGTREATGPDQTGQAEQVTPS